MAGDPSTGSGTGSTGSGTGSPSSERVPTAQMLVDEIWAHWCDAVNLTADELEAWLGTEESLAVGHEGDDDESTGHESGRRIVGILRTERSALSRADVAHMRKVIGYVRRHVAQRPDGDVTQSPWRHSLMNWGHDPSKRA